VPDHYGNLLIPVQPASDKEAPGDPLLDVLLSFFEAVLNADAGGAWKSVGVGPETSGPVVHKFAWDPVKQAFDKSKTPALYLFREFNNPSEWIAHDYYIRHSQLVLYWVPPVVAQQEKRGRMTAFANAIQSVLDNTLEPAARHPAWQVASDTDPLTSLYGSLLWRYANLWKLDIGRSEWTEIVIPTDMTGMPPGTTPPKFPAVRTTILVGERNEGTVPEDFDTFTLDGTIQTAVTSDEGVLDYLDFDFTLGIASVSPATGSSAGGTTLVVLGTGFDADAAVTVSGVACTDVSVSAPGALTCRTPPGSPLLGALDVVVTNPDGDAATAVDAFTYVTPPSIDLGTWTLNNTTRTGTYPTYTFLETAVSNFHGAFSPSTPISGATSVRVTARVQMVGRQWFWLNITPLGNPDEYAYFDLTNGVFGYISPGVSAVGITNLGAGLWEVTATFDLLSSPFSWVASFGLDTANNQGTYLGDITKGCVISYLLAEQP
jgi:hypothetical protein